MKKFSTFIFLSFFIAGAAYAQERQPTRILKKDQPQYFTSYLLRRQAETCTVLNFDPDVENYVIYEYVDDAGFVTGVNKYADQEIAAVFEAPSDARYITKIGFAIAAANSNIPANLNKEVVFKVYDLNHLGDPDDVIASATVTLGDLKTAVDAATLTEVVFSSPVDLPDDKRFAVSIDISNLTWDVPSEMDSLVLTSWDVTEPEENFLVKAGNVWLHGSLANPDVFLNLSIFPLVSEDPACLDPTPVKLSSFEVQNRNGYNELTWTTETEQNNAGFEVERSPDGKSFYTIASVNSKAQGGNSGTALKYNFRDNRPLSGANYYRLLQKDFDGKISLSKVISAVNSEGSKRIIEVFPNPVTTTLNVNFFSSAPQKSVVRVLNMQGNVLLQKNYDLRRGENILNIDVGRLPKGSYLIKVSSADETHTTKFVK